MSSYPVTCQACGEKSDSIGKHECPSDDADEITSCELCSVFGAQRDECYQKLLEESAARDKLAERVLRLEKALTDIVRRCECICDQGRVCATCIAQLALQAEGEGK